MRQKKRMALVMSTLRVTRQTADAAARPTAVKSVETHAFQHMVVCVWRWRSGAARPRDEERAR